MRTWSLDFWPKFRPSLWPTGTSWKCFSSECSANKWALYVAKIALAKIRNASRYITIEAFEQSPLRVYLCNAFAQYSSMKPSEMNGCERNIAIAVSSLAHFTFCYDGSDRSSRRARETNATRYLVRELFSMATWKRLRQHPLFVDSSSNVFSPIFRIYIYILFLSFW